jgi:hypothetical protein
MIYFYLFLEGQIQYNIARVMKRHSCRWTIEGGDRMSQVLEVLLPILEGRFAGRPWITYVLKEITEPRV